MPYVIKGKSVIKKTTGKVVGRSKNPKKYMKVLNMVEHGWKPNALGKTKGVKSAR